MRASARSSREARGATAPTTQPAAPEGEITELELRDQLKPLARRRRLIVLVTLLVLAPAMAWSFLARPTYQARARVLVETTRDSDIFQAREGRSDDPNRIVQTEVLVFESPQLRAEVRKRIGTAPRVSAFQLGQTDVIEIVAEQDDARRAAEVANAYANAYIDLRRQQAVADVVAAAEQLQAKISELQQQINTSVGEQQNARISQQALFRQKLDELQVDSALRKGGARLISDAAPPKSPVSPDPLRTGIVGLVFGVILAVGVALAVDYLDDTVRSVEHVERVVAGTRVIGMIPAFSGVGTHGPNGTSGALPIVSVEDPSSPAAEAFRTLRTSLQFLFLERRVGTVQVTSPNPGDGKSSIVANLAVAVARAGTRVTVVDCDLRRPQASEFFQVDDSVGLTSVLIGDVPLAEAIVPAPGIPRLAVLPAGPPPPNPSEVLATPRMAELIASLRATGSVVILDSPPVLPVTDALVLSSRADATVLVCAAGRTRFKQLRHAVGLLKNVKAPLAGVVLNAVPRDTLYGGRYEYRSYDAKARAGRRQRRAEPRPGR